ncbi:CocE/NonD family hydrolase [Burkholderia gladioli pv. gladioli]|uniref:Hydrolase CocE/NonD family protein n=1 Tax=Burkholderia gladioli TaxID=28095 RepID=A0A095F3K6_BURGA|nr:CocE/NonD family hydrolase [Burkholderia gladioli]AJW98275.1 hydrolase CocE/NonD family protein [Burkholderia gladioli]ASD79928.1 hypothetical protein CEJ98_13630 [Burkholderia gladioli pv. gladioli]AWY54830.1 hypothetical protein A8H28_27500 [Burkholderia gladioli pv. gladioli]KGC11550.1 hydrolase CocE/NonD family protein [Burkholderia gladioli]MDJ1164171.1 CocE/NonD family hydrolase [Burkholderia gladioli pv. gladioli]
MLTSESTILSVTMSDGISVAVRVYGPLDKARPVLFAASPYRFDNDDIPETTTFLWRETGPIDWYVEQGYTYVHLDVRGTGRSGGEYEFFSSRERRDLFETIEWIAVQDWCTGKIGGIGHSYYAISQWCMASERPPSLACIAPYDGGLDLYRQWAYHGGLFCHFTAEWWHGNVRPINLHPLMRDAPKRDISLDLPRLLSLHPTIDAFWEDRAFAHKLDGCQIPVLSFGAWAKRDLHLPGNIEGFNRFAGPRHLLISGTPSMPAIQGDFESISFHQKHLLPFYDKYLKGLDTGFERRPSVTFEMREAGQTVLSTAWPPKSQDLAFWLSGTKADACVSLNDGALLSEPRDCVASTSYSYPDPRWAFGNVELTSRGPDPTSRNLTFTSAMLEEDLDVVGYPKLRLFLSTNRSDADVIVKLVELRHQADASVSSIQSIVVAKGWLRGSHRAIRDRRFGISHCHAALDLLAPGEIYELEFTLTPVGHKFKAGSRIRLDVSCADSPITDSIFVHEFTPDKVGEDTIYHSLKHGSVLHLPVMDASAVVFEPWPG